MRSYSLASSSTFTFFFFSPRTCAGARRLFPGQMTSASNAAAKKIRTEYMKKFREPKWETFSKCYQDSVRYRLSRRVMEHTHRPLFGDGWDSGSDSSTGSSTRGRVLTESSNPHPSSSESADTPRLKAGQDTDTPEHNALPVGR